MSVSVNVSVNVSASAPVCIKRKSKHMCMASSGGEMQEDGFPNSSQPFSPCFVLGTADFMGRDDATNVARFSLVNPAR